MTSHVEFVVDTLKRIKAAAERCAAGRSDPIDDCLEIHALASRLGDAGEPIAELFHGIESELDELPRGDALRLASPEFAASSAAKKADFRRFFGSDIRAKCAEAVRLCDRALARSRL